MKEPAWLPRTGGYEVAKATAQVFNWGCRRAGGYEACILQPRPSASGCRRTGGYEENGR
jgi:hypothetical protein